MKKQNINTKQGFTIIEVVLVLAIAGLIFLMVFIAWPALQRSQHDTQRRDDMARFISQLSQYQTNNDGKTPEATKQAYNDFIKNYLTLGGKDKFNDPSTNSTYTVDGLLDCSKNTCEDRTITESGTGKIYIYTNATCDGEKATLKKGNNNIAVRIKLEGAGTYCGHN